MLENNIKVYNSLTNKMEDFKPIKKDEISMYVCGPTVYNHMHIGNARPVVFFDTVRRFFEYIGYQVKMVSNFTDIDDKIIQKAIEENTTEDSISEKYIKAYLDACDKIGCNKQVIHPRVTEHIEDIILYIDRLVKTAHAYQSGDDVYFDVRSIPEYGILSNQKLDNLESGSRIDINKNKKDPADFTLWKKTNDIGKKWPSPFGMGRPGWHTECVVMIDKIFGGKIDIHGGGNDLKFPHHENEIAQSEQIQYFQRFVLFPRKVGEEIAEVEIADDAAYGREYAQAGKQDHGLPEEMGHLGRFIPCVVHGHVFVDGRLEAEIRQGQPDDDGIAQHENAVFILSQAGQDEGSQEKLRRKSGGDRYVVEEGSCF